MSYLAGALMVLGFVAAGVYLILHDHLWLGFFCLLAATCVTVGPASKEGGKA